MNPVTEFHEQAMDYAEEAEFAKRRGNLDAFNEYSLQAYELEMQALELLRDNLNTEPTRSILYRSAAALAIDCKKYPDAVRLAEIGLGGYPPLEVAEELRDIIEQANFYHHIQANDVELASNELQLTNNIYPENQQSPQPASNTKEVRSTFQ